MGTPRRVMFTISASSTAARPTVVAHRRVNKTRAKRSVVVHGAKSNPVSSGYAAALVDACKSSGALEQVHADMETLDAYVKANAIVAEKKKDVLAKLGKEAGFHAFTGNFLNLLVDKRRENQIEAIIAEFETLFCEATDTQVATVTSAVKLENEQQFMIAKKLQEMTGAKNIKLKPEVDESLLGGFVVQYGKDGSGFIDM